MSAMNIGEAAKASGVSAKMIRYYESQGLIQKAARTDAGYRRYTGENVHVLRFIRRARDLGFSIAQIGELVGLWQNRRRSSSKVKQLALEHVKQLDLKIREMLEMKATLEHLATCCNGDHRPECPILESLAADAPLENRVKPAARRGALRSRRRTETAH